MRQKSGAIRRVLRDCAIFLALALFGVLIAARFDRMAPTRHAGPFAVVDGDTLAAGGRRVRLTGIDAPELAQLCERSGASWKCGQAARRALRDLVEGRSVECEASGKDRYGRLLARCLTDGDQDIAAAMVRTGMAVATEFPRYFADERLARARRRGIWAGGFSFPAEWRKEHRAAEPETTTRPVGGIGFVR